MPSHVIGYAKNQNRLQRRWFLPPALFYICRQIRQELLMWVYNYLTFQDDLSWNMPGFPFSIYE